jgi:hypothetical protein
VALGLKGQTGAVVAGYLADLLVVNGDPSRDVTILGEPDKLLHVYLNGREMQVPAPLPRTDPPGWRGSTYGSQILRRDEVIR